jgi:ParB/RepB/Spo0J family partition protein
MELNAKLVDLKDIKPSQYNARKTFDDVKLKELSASIKEKGVIEPIIVRPANGKYEVVCGERRFRASRMAGLSNIPAVIKELDEKQALEYQIIENLHREDVHPLEEAEGYEVLMKKHGYKTVDDIAAKVGKSRAYIYGRMKLCDLIQENRKLFYEGKLNPSVALLVARIPAHLQKEAGKKVSQGGIDNEPMSYRRAQEFITKEFMLVLKAALFDTDDALLIESSGSCTMCQKRTGNQKELFPDVSSADVCTDPVCFKAKKDAGVKRALAKAKESGKIVLTEKEAKKVFFGEDSMHLGEGYINLESVCTEDKSARKYKQLVKAVKDAKIVVGINPYSGELAAMIHRTEAARIRKQCGIAPEKVAKEARRTTAGSGIIKDRQAVKRDDEEAEDRGKTAARVVEEIMINVRRDTKMSFLRIMATCMLEAATTGVMNLFMKRRDPAIKCGEVEEKVREHLEAISDTELLGFCLELVILGESEWGKEGDSTRALCKLYGIDANRFKKEPAAQNKAGEVKEPEEARVKMRDGKTFEYNGKGGKKVVVKSKYLAWMIRRKPGRH